MRNRHSYLGEMETVKPRFFAHNDEMLLIGSARTFANPWRGRAILLGRVLVYGYMSLMPLYYLFAPALVLFGIKVPHLLEWVIDADAGFIVCYFGIKILLALRARTLGQRLAHPGEYPVEIQLTDQLRMLFPADLGLVQVSMYPPSYVAFHRWEQEQPHEEQTVESVAQQEPSPLLMTADALPTKEGEETSSPTNEVPLERKDAQKIPKVVDVEIFLFETLTLILIDDLGRRFPFPFPKSYSGRYPALIAYLATHGNCTRQKLKQQLYSTLSDQDNSFDTDRQERIMPIIQKVASRYGLVLTSSLFENAQDVEKGAVWRLRRYCRVDSKIQEQLERYYTMVLASQNSQRILDLEELRDIGENTIKFHGKGYLGEYNFSEAWWSWARTSFLHYRKMALVIVNELAAQEYQAGKRAKGELEQKQYFQRAVEHYTWCMKTAMHRILDIQSADLACSQLITIYREHLKDKKAAVKLLRTYEKNLRKGHTIEDEEDEDE
jgi:hypothetical protein